MDLLELTKDNGAFSKVVPGLQIVWDSTSLGLYKTCPRKYYLSIIEGWQAASPPAGMEHTPALDFGLKFHKAVELYDKWRSQGKEHEECLRLAVRYALEATGYWTAPEGNCGGCGAPYTAATVRSEHIPLVEGTRLKAISFQCCKCLHENEVETDLLNWHPWRSDDTSRTRMTLVRAIVWYLDRFQNDTCETIQLSDGKPAVELSFKFNLDFGPESSPGETYALAGHLDRLVRYQSFPYVMDRKTTKSQIGSDYASRYSPDNQMSLYSLAGQVVWEEPVKGVLIDAVQTQVNSTDFARFSAPRTEAQLAEWLRHLKFWLTKAEFNARQGEWEMNDTACHTYGGCPFRGSCGKDPAVRDMFLKTDFKRRVWDPTVPRE